MSERLSEACMGLAKHMSRKLCAALDYWDESELESVAMISLVKAERTFDPCRGVKFSSWAGILIERDILDEVKRQKKRRMPSIFVENGFGKEGVRGECSESTDARLDLDEAIKRLNRGQASLVQAYLAGEKVIDFARARGVSKSAGSQQFRSAVKNLRKVMGGGYVDAA